MNIHSLHIKEKNRKNHTRAVCKAHLFFFFFLKVQTNCTVSYFNDSVVSLHMRTHRFLPASSCIHSDRKWPRVNRFGFWKIIKTSCGHRNYERPRAFSRLCSTHKETLIPIASRRGSHFISPAFRHTLGGSSIYFITKNPGAAAATVETSPIFVGWFVLVIEGPLCSLEKC